jgi:hypothetical protein
VLKSVQGDPEFMRRFNGWCVIFFFAFWMAAWIFGWVNSVSLISHLSFIALVLASLAAWQASRTEVRQKKDEKRRAAESKNESPEPSND